MNEDPGAKWVSFIYPIDHVHVLEAMARQEGVTVGQFVREAVDSYLARTPVKQKEPNILKHIKQFILSHAPTAASATHFLTAVVLPPAVGIVAAFVASHYNVGGLGLTQSAVAHDLSSLGVVAIGSITAWATQHHFLKGTYASAVKQRKL